MSAVRDECRRDTSVTALLLGGFWIAQALVAIIFKLGSSTPKRWVPCFVIGNAIGVSSAVLWMLALRGGGANVVTGLAVGGAFVVQQVALILVFGGGLTYTQIAGIAAILGGMAGLACGAAPRPRDAGAPHAVQS